MFVNVCYAIVLCISFAFLSYFYNTFFVISTKYAVNRTYLRYSAKLNLFESRPKAVR